jgi:hypothetical protein
VIKTHAGYQQYINTHDLEDGRDPEDGRDSAGRRRDMDPSKSRQGQYQPDLFDLGSGDRPETSNRQTSDATRAGAWHRGRRRRSTRWRRVPQRQHKRRRHGRSVPEKAAEEDPSGTRSIAPGDENEKKIDLYCSTEVASVRKP